MKQKPGLVSALTNLSTKGIQLDFEKKTNKPLNFLFLLFDNLSSLQSNFFVKATGEQNSKGNTNKTKAKKQQQLL